MRCKKWILFLFLGMFFSKGFAEEKYYLSICTIFQNEAPYLKEWIEYHRLMGVEHFYFYNNNSTDGFRKVLEPYLKQGIAELKDWPTKEENRARNLITREQKFRQWRIDQPAAYNDCIKNSSTQWLAVIDVDEFVVPMQHPDLLSFLEQFDNEPMLAAIRVNWQNYGTSNLAKIPAGGLVIEHLLWKAPWDYPRNQLVKSIFRPSAVEKMTSHLTTNKEGFYTLPNEMPFGEGPVQIDEIRINHYWTRAEDFFYSTKKARQEKIHGEKHKEILKKAASELNQVYDPLLLRVVPELKERMR